MAPNAYRDRLIDAKEALSAAFLSPPSPDVWQVGMLRLLQKTALSFAQEGAARGAIRFDEVVQKSPPVVHAIGVGRKITNGDRTGTPAVRVYVTRKADVRPSEHIPETVSGVATDVIEAPPARFLAAPCTASRTAAIRPLIAGISTSHASGDTGTVAYFCRFPNVSGVYVLSNAHIYANYGAAAAGDPLLQPGAADGGSAGSQVASFHTAVPLLFGGAPNEVDAALGELLPGMAYNASICTIGAVNGTAQAVEDDPVVKHGRTTGYTEGVIDDELIDFIMLPDNSTSYVKFRNQMRIVPTGPAGSVIASGGDSGSLVVKKAGQAAVGLLHSAAIDGSYAYANHIDKVLSLLGVVLL